MRLIRFPARPARVSDDIRAALASFGPGCDILGGIGLLGVRPSGMSQDVDAVLVLPHGVLVVVGLDLPHPAMRLTAPLSDPWELDGWPLVSTEDTVNPAVDALTFAHAVTERIHAVESGVPVGIVLAVGPYVERVEQPLDELTGPVRIVHPKPALMRATILSLLPSGPPALTAERAGTLLRRLSPAVPQLDSAAFMAEGFTSSEPQSFPAAVPDRTDLPDSGGTATALSGPVAHPVRTAPDRTTPERATPGRVSPALPLARTRSRPWPTTRSPHALPVQTPRRLRRTLRRAFAVVGLLVVVAGIAIAIAATRSTSPPSTPPVADEPNAVRVHDIRFAEIASAFGSDCSGHAVGDIEVTLSGPDCTGLQRSSFATTVAGQDIAVSVTTVHLVDEERALAFHALADTPGSGAVSDLAVETGRWPESTPDFGNAAYATTHDGTTVRMVLTVPLNGPSKPNDPALLEAAEAALAIPPER